MSAARATEIDGARPKRVAIAAGGTAGHVYPGIAFAEAFQSRFPDADLLFVGAEGGLEERIVPRHGYRLATVGVRPLAGVGTIGRLGSLRAFPGAVKAAREVLAAQGARLLVALGGYASAPYVVAARILRLPIVIHEANAVPGISNSLLGRFADRVHVTSPAARRRFAQAEVSITGTPVRRAIAQTYLEREPPSFTRPVRLLVIGGSLGSPFLNERAPELMSAIARSGVQLEVRHQSGRPDPEPVRAAYRTLGIQAEVEPYYDEIAAVYRWADFALARAGASTLSELAAAGVPSLLVPLPEHARNHQFANALAFAAEAGAGCVEEHQWRTAPIAERLVAMLADPARLIEASRRLRAHAPLDAAERLVHACDELMVGRW